MNVKKQLDDIELAVACNELSAAQVFTKMRDLVNELRKDTERLTYIEDNALDLRTIATGEDSFAWEVCETQCNGELEVVATADERDFRGGLDRAIDYHSRNTTEVKELLDEYFASKLDN